MDTPFPWFMKFYFGNHLKVLKRTVIEFCGIRPTRTTRIWSLKVMSEAGRKRWLEKMADWGRKAR
jgi:putative NADPH-quinone reductase